MKKHILYLLLVGLMFSACQDPEYVLPTATRQGITSLTAIFTKGEYNEKIAVEYKVPDATADRFVIPIPFYYPESSDNDTEQFMTSFKVQAELTPNYLLSPALGIIDLTIDNYYTLTEPDGTKRRICITGERKKTSACQILSFSLPDLGIIGSIDEDHKTIALPTLDELSLCYASYTLSPHASISPDPAVELIDFNEEVNLTITAHDGTQSVYTVEKRIPEKINSGYRAGSETLAYTIDLTTHGLPAVSHPTIGVCGNHLVVCYGDGSTPIYFNAATGGNRLGTINTGGKVINGSVTSDVAGCLLMCNYAQGGETWSLYLSEDVTADPIEIMSMTNTNSLPIGSRLTITGDIKGDAIIAASFDGIGGVAGSNEYVRCVITNGVAGPIEVLSVSGVDYWYGMDSNTKIAYRTTRVSDGFFLGHYNSGDRLYYVDGVTNSVISYLNDQTGGSGWGYNNSIVSATTFNNVEYLALYTVGYFPQWAMNSVVYLYDVSSMSAFTGNVNASDALKLSASVTSYNYSDPSEPRTGDVLLVPSTNGFKMSMYYIDNTCKTLGCYEFDCIKK